MRIALIATHHCDYAANLAVALAERHEVLLVLNRHIAGLQIAPASLRWLAKRVRLRFVPHQIVPLQPLVALRCWQHVRAFRPDIVHVQEHPTRSTAWLAAWLPQALPLVTTVHDPVPHTGDDEKAASVYEAYNRRVRARSNGLIAHGALLARQMTEVSGAQAAPPPLVANIAHGVLRFGLHGPDAPDPAVLHPRRLIFFGRMEAYKGLDTLLDANDLWRAAGVDIDLCIAGRGPEIARHRARLAAPNITLCEGNVPQAQLAALVRSSVAAILPYHGATQSGVAASAFGVGRPVIASDVGALAEAVGDAGLLVPPGDAQALAHAGQRLVHEPGLLARLEAAVARRAAGPLSWAAIAAQTGDLYERVLSAASPGVGEKR